jgi:predicted dehydrogenase
MTVTYGFEHERRLRAGFIGCGGHSFRNVYPVLRYLPVDLVAVCDLDGDRAATYARTFGAERSYTDHEVMLAECELDCVFVVTGVSSYATLACDALAAGAAVWTEKPPVASLDDVVRIRAAMASSGKQYAVGLKKAFAPANQKLRELTRREDFGAVQSLALRYAQFIPTVDDLVSKSPASDYFLDHLCHPLAVLRLLGGPVASMFYERAPNGSGVATFTMTSGAIASLHLPWAFSMRATQERTEVNGERASAWAENNTRVTFAPNPRFRDLSYGRDPDHTTDPHAMTVWEPEFSLGQLYNTGAFLLGYFGELAHFCAAVLDDTAIEIGGIDWAEEGIRIFDAFAEGPGRVIPVLA